MLGEFGNRVFDKLIHGVHLKIIYRTVMNSLFLWPYNLLLVNLNIGWKNNWPLLFIVLLHVLNLLSQISY